MNFLPLLLQLIGGAIGGNAAGSLAKDASLGTAGNTIAGALGGGVGMQILGALFPALAGIGGAAATGGSMDIGAILGSLAGGGVTGAIIQYVVGMIKNRMA